MAKDRPVYMGPRLRRLRRELGLTQADMANDLEISASYVALLERNQRPLTADMLLRLARTYKLDMAEVAGDGGALIWPQTRPSPIVAVKRRKSPGRLLLTALTTAYPWSKSTRSWSKTARPFTRL